MKTTIDPFRIEMVESIRLTTPDEREEILQAAHFNPILKSYIEKVIEAMQELAVAKEQIEGMRITKAPEVLRHFTARFAEM